MRSTFSSIEHLQDLFNLKRQSKKSDFFMYFYESVEFETRQKTTKSLNKPNAVKKLKKKMKCTDIKKPLKFRGLLEIIRWC